MENKEISVRKKLLVLWVTSGCNLTCKYCYAAGVKAERMSFETAKKAIDLMGEGPLQIQFAGGEPFLNFPLIEQICDYTKDRPGITFSVQTNGTLFQEDMIAVIKKYKIAIGISMDGKPETNECLRGKTKDVLAGITLLKKHGIVINLNAVVSDANVEKLKELVDLAMYLGNVHGIGLDLLRQSGRAKGQDAAIKRANPEKLKKGLLELKERLDYVNLVLPRKIILREFEQAKYRMETNYTCKEYCYASSGNSFVILPNGDCYPCGSLVGRPEFYQGNIHEQLKGIGIAIEPLQGCKECEYYSVCPTGCPSRGILYGEMDPLDCTLRKTAFEIVQQVI